MTNPILPLPKTASGLQTLNVHAGLPVSAETCPHYLSFAAEDIPDGATSFKCAPPIRAAANREALWSGLREGILDGIATDHSPAPPELKLLDTGDFLAAWGGIAGALLSHGVGSRVSIDSCKQGAFCERGSWTGSSHRTALPRPSRSCWTRMTDWLPGPSQAPHCARVQGLEG